MKNPFYTKVDNTFHRVMEDVSKFEQAFKAGGKLEQAIMELGGDPAWLADVTKTLDTLQEQLEEAHHGAVGHLDHETGEPMESVMEGQSLTEGVLDNDDDDGFMARSQLYFLARDAITLHGMIGDRDNLAGWVQSKITNAAEGIEAVRRYTEYNLMKAQSQMPDMDMEPEMDTDMEEAVDNPYAVGMAQAMRSTGDKPPLKKATIRKAHDIAKAIEKSDESVMEADGRPYICVHAKKGTHECHASSSYEAAKKAAAHWKLKSTAGIDAYLADVKHTPTESVEEVKEGFKIRDTSRGYGVADETYKTREEAKKAAIMKAASTGSHWEVIEEGMNFDDNRSGELKTVANDMFKNALAAAKKKAKK